MNHAEDPKIDNYNFETQVYEVGHEKESVSIYGGPTLYPLFIALNKLYKDARTPSSVFIHGESGTGKELVAKALHWGCYSERDGNYMPLNCAAIPHFMAESTLFGHVKGTFTGAVSNRDGAFKYANKGTIFLDEIDSLPKRQQTKLLRALQEREVCPVGSEKPYDFDVRVVAAASADLQEYVRKEGFNEALYYRLHVVSLHIPPLRERVGDIDGLAKYLLKVVNREKNMRVESIDDSAIAIMQEYPWPGNARELRNCIEHAVVMGDGIQIKEEDVRPRLREVLQMRGRGGEDLEKERQRIVTALEAANNKREEAAKILGIARGTLYRRMKKLGM